MTIALSIKVNDGVVLAADSASTLISIGATGEDNVINVYNNANKIFNLKKGWPIGAVSWGLGNIGNASISTLMKDLRQRFDENSNKSRQSAWSLDKGKYTVQHVAELVRKFFFEEHYAVVHKGLDSKPSLGFIVAGYSANGLMAEEYQINIINGECSTPIPIRSENEAGVTWNGQTDAISRLLLGFGIKLPNVLSRNLGVPDNQIESVMNIFRQEMAVPLVVSAMPIQDAIDLAAFLVETTIQFSRFSPGAPVVGGPIEIAVITKHEGFKWIRRKYYYPKELNPTEESPYDQQFKSKKR